MRKLVIDMKRCTGCGDCVTECPFTALRQESGKILFKAAACLKECRICQMKCPFDAIEFELAQCQGCGQDKGKGCCTGKSCNGCSKKTCK